MRGENPKIHALRRPILSSTIYFHVMSGLHQGIRVRALLDREIDAGEHQRVTDGFTTGR